MEFTSVKDSGNRQVFSSGAQRDMRAGKGRYDLIPWYAIHRLAVHFENGAKKYGRHNWAKGMPLSDYLDSASRHIGNAIDGKIDEDHAAAAMWNIACFLATQKMIQDGILPQELDDWSNRPWTEVYAYNLKKKNEGKA